MWKWWYSHQLHFLPGWRHRPKIRPIPMESVQPLCNDNKSVRPHLCCKIISCMLRGPQSPDWFCEFDALMHLNVAWTVCPTMMYGLKITYEWVMTIHTSGPDAGAGGTDTFHGWTLSRSRMIVGLNGNSLLILVDLTEKLRDAIQQTFQGHP